MTGSPFDKGLQPERTTLAWRRTVLAAATGFLCALRFLPPALGTWAAWAAVVGLVSCVVLWRLAERRSRLTYRALLSGPRPLLPGAVLLLLLALLLAALASCALMWTVANNQATTSTSLRTGCSSPVQGPQHRAPQPSLEGHTRLRHFDCPLAVFLSHAGPQTLGIAR